MTNIHGNDTDHRFLRMEVGGGRCAARTVREAGPYSASPGVRWKDRGDTGERIATPGKRAGSQSACVDHTTALVFTEAVGLC